MASTLPRIYMAGPDVFRRDYARHKAQLRQWAAQSGLTAVCPGDDEVAGESPQAVSRAIFELNVLLIDSCDYVAANVCDFRGHEPDSGTVFEIGYAIGRGKKVWCYHAPALPLVRQIAQPEPGYCRDGMLVEDFGLSRNLMIAHACTLLEGDAGACLAQIAAWHAAFA